MARSYDLDAAAASKVGVSSYISETGKYAGKFLCAEAKVSEQGTEGVEFTFEATDGRRANYLQLWTFNSDGKQLYGFSVLSAIMTCLRMKSIHPKAMPITDNKGTRQAQGFPELCGKPIGLLLEREETEKRDGTASYRFVIKAPFDPATELVAAEILRRDTTPSALPKMVAQLRDRPLQGRREHAATASASAGGAASSFGDDDILF